MSDRYDIDALDPLLPELHEWRRIENIGPARECPTWLEELAEEYPHLKVLCAEWRKPMTAELELALDDLADKLRSRRQQELA